MNLFSILLTCFELAFLWWLFSDGFKNFFIDDTREKLFKIRDVFFDKAKSEKISFKAPAYQMTRLTLNGMIRFTHEINLTHIVLSISALCIAGMYEDIKKHNNAYNKSIKELTKDSQEIIFSVNKEMHLTILKHMLKTSIIFTAILIVIIPLAVLIAALSVVFKRFFDRVVSVFWKSIDFEANSIGKANC